MAVAVKRKLVWEDRLMAVRTAKKVWEDNLLEEMWTIRRQFSKSSIFLASIDTEFPGTVFKSKQPLSTMTPEDHYLLMKKNVDATNMIQLGLTLSDSESHYVWEFNFRDFDPQLHAHDPASIALLKSQGIDFAANRRHGIRATTFRRLFVKLSGLTGPWSMERAWITFHGMYDLGYMIKIMTGKPSLPEDLKEFMLLVRIYFGRHVYDLKAISHGMGKRGGLEKVAESVGVERSEGRSHQAGSDSLVTMQAFVGLMDIDSGAPWFVSQRYQERVYGLTWLPTAAEFGSYPGGGGGAIKSGCTDSRTVAQLIHLIHFAVILYLIQN